MMRISPLGIFGANYDLPQVGEWAQQDAALTHPHPVCRQASALFAVAIAHAISTGIGSQDLFRQIETWAREMKAKSLTPSRSSTSVRFNLPAPEHSGHSIVSVTADGSVVMAGTPFRQAAEPRDKCREVSTL
jgi:ADP-ribosylglycohydrolase